MNSAVFGPLYRNEKLHTILVVVCSLAMMFSPATAQETWNQVGVIIDYGDDRTTWMWIPFEGEETSLIDLIHSTDMDIVTVSFGGLGEGVCQIDATGCPAADCRARLCQTNSSSPFWRLMKLNGDEWGMVATGVSGAKVSDGDIYALSWSSETPEFPLVSMDELAINAGADRDAEKPMSAIRTEGESPEDEATPTWIPATTAFGILVLAGGVLIFRAKRPTRDVA